MSFILQDSGSQLWTVSIDDSGVLHTATVGSGTPVTIDLNNAGNTTSWLVGITTLGELTATSISFASYPTTYAVTSISGNTHWNLGITTVGDMKTAQVTVTAAAIGGFFFIG